MKASTMSKVINWLRTDPGGTCTPLDVLPVRRRMFDVFSRDDLLTWWLIDSGLTPAQPSDVELAYLMVCEESADVNEIERFRSQRLAPLGLCA
ncbi:hypothetical protein [Corynebacterium durum]|nr:hypothetical protein [Corynebacterium durum]MDO4651240.1 hypothetical protein [Corynebacterium durum]